MTEKAGLLVEEHRGPLVECEYVGHLVAVDLNGAIVREIGNPRHVTYMRSAAKPFQALPFFARGLHRQLKLTEDEQAILTASHRSQPFHVETLESLMAKIGVEERQLACGAAYPLHGPSRVELLKREAPARRLYHNCSGKHLGMLAVCRAAGYPEQGYEQPSHPLQREIIDLLSELSGCDAEDIAIGIDGCGLPVFGLPIYHMARAFLRLARPETIGDGKLSAAASDLTAAMHTRPLWVSGSDLICPALLEDPNIVAKGGAKGIYCFALKEQGIGIAFKVMDGSEDKWPFVVASILMQIGYEDKRTIERLLRLCPVEIVNGSGTLVGEHRIGFDWNEDK